jgi:hypothetical protein
VLAARPDLGERGPSRLATTPSSNRLSEFRTTTHGYAATREAAMAAFAKTWRRE